MKKLQVIYKGWGEHWPLGLLADTGQEILFEYSSPAIERGLQLSPLHQPLPRSGQAIQSFKGPTHTWGLPGFIADSLPDGWGLLLMDRALRTMGRNPQEVSVLTRLAMVADRGIGALSFEPAEDSISKAEQLELKELAQTVRNLQAYENESKSDSKADSGLIRMLQLGGSPQGARPKVLVDFDVKSGAISNASIPETSATPWLIKFPAQSEHIEVCAIEELYARVARKGKIEIPQSRFFNLGKQLSAFGVERFDRIVSRNPQEGTHIIRVPVTSLSAYLQADHRVPSLDYITVLHATMRITGDQRELLKAFERCIFNVLMHNRDDHSKNFAFRLNQQGQWKLAPAFDLTYSFGPRGEHSTTVSGHGKNITRAHLLNIAAETGIAQGVANEAIDCWIKQVKNISKLANDLPIRQSTIKQLIATINMQAKALVS